MTIPPVNDFHVASGFLVGKDVRLISAGVPRSGSTLVWQVASDIVGPHVPKTHTFLDIPDVPAILTIRDPRDCMASVWTKDSPNVLPTNEDVMRLIAEYRMWFTHAEFYLDTHATVLRYEVFWQDYSSIFDAIDDLICCFTPFRSRLEIARRRSIEANSQIAETLDDCHDPATHIHPRHIGTVEPGSWRQVFSVEQQQIATDKLRDILRMCSYSCEVPND